MPQLQLAQVNQDSVAKLFWITEDKFPGWRHGDRIFVQGTTALFVGTEGFEQSGRERKKIEMRFAHLKRILRLDRLRLRGPRGAQDEFVLAAIAQNLRRLAALVARPPPAEALCIA